MEKNNLLFLRRLHGNLHEWRLERQRAFAYWKNLSFPLGKKVYVVGTPEHKNMGDGAIALAEMAFLEKCGFDGKRIKEVTYREFRRDKKLIKKCIRKNSLICWHGGGNMGDQWIGEEHFRRNGMMDFNGNQMIIFPQTIFYTPTESGEQEKQKSIQYYNKKDKLMIVAREKKSFDIMRTLYPETKIILTPDIVLSTDCAMYGVGECERTDFLTCFRTDPEKQLSDEDGMKIQRILSGLSENVKNTDMYCDIPVTKYNRRECVQKKMQEFMSAKLVVTDRLHGMVFAAITETPCIVFSNYNQKVSGTYEWIKSLPYIRFVESIDEMQIALQDLLKLEDAKFDNSSWLEHFSELEKQVQKYL